MIKKFFKKVYSAIQWTKKILKNKLFPKWNYISKEQRKIIYVILISFFITFIPYTYSIIFFEQNTKAIIDCLLIPFLVIFFISIVEYLFAHKLPIVLKNISTITKIIIIIVIQFILGLLLFVYEYEIDREIKSNRIEYYPLALKLIYSKDRIKHFPTELPSNAKNPVIYTSFGRGENIYLKFDTNKEFIENELKKYTYIDIKNYNNNSCYNFWVDHNKIDISRFDFYIINYKIPYHYGFGINKEKNSIIYYYEGF